MRETTCLDCYNYKIKNGDKYCIHGLEEYEDCRLFIDMNEEEPIEKTDYYTDTSHGGFQTFKISNGFMYWLSILEPNEAMIITSYLCGIPAKYISEIHGINKNNIKDMIDDIIDRLAINGVQLNKKVKTIHFNRDNKLDLELFIDYPEIRI